LHQGKESVQFSVAVNSLSIEQFGSSIANELLSSE